MIAVLFGNFFPAKADEERPNPMLEKLKMSEFESRCLAQAQAGKVIEVSKVYWVKCDTHNIFQNPLKSSYFGRYRIIKRGKHIELNINILFVYIGAKENLDLVKNRLKKVVASLIDVFAENHLKLTITYNIFSANKSIGNLLNWVPPPAYDHAVKILDEWPSGQIRPFSDTWILNHDNIRLLLRTVTHEFGHLLGLEDTYSDIVSCPDRPTTLGPYLTEEGCFLEETQSSCLLTAPQFVRLVSPLCPRFRPFNKL